MHTWPEDDRRFGRFSGGRRKSCVSPVRCDAHLTLHTLEEEDIFHPVEELKHASLQPSEGGRGFTVFGFSALDFPGPILFSSFSEEKPAERSLLLPQSSDMKRALISVLVMIFTLGGTRAQTVTQPESHVPVSEGDPVQVKCSYSYSGSPALFWYVQYPRQRLQLLLKHTSKESIQGFTAELSRAEASFHLKKPSAQEEDSAVYYCALGNTVPGFTREAERKPLTESISMFPI
ncbi:hypothetical protein JEQ12_017942 [Ovis aries]|uniref:Ig-like domain-containing protein n=1 Tax=Ovis aries TaxID=9940 RepID=A0A836A032_SHEEP|nr:hypothetical protein JEQ12_017942 [Ovis aries]